MNVYFTVYSPILLQGLEDTLAFKEAEECGALIKVNHYDYEMVISKMSDNLIEAVILAHIEGMAPQEYKEQLLPIDGGLRIEHDDLVIEHQCCSEINDYQNWERIVDEQASEWKEIWIGHPSIYYRIAGNEIQFSQYYDTNPHHDQIEVRMTLDKIEFLEKLKIALDDLKVFKKRILSIIENRDFQNKEELARNIMN